jgi:hypothetical protein
MLGRLSIRRSGSIIGGVIIALGLNITLVDKLAAQDRAAWAVVPINKVA